eukprot:7951964-Pyramimonas_sp.AAC.1
MCAPHRPVGAPARAQGVSTHAPPRAGFRPRHTPAGYYAGAPVVLERSGPVRIHVGDFLRIRAPGGHFDDLRSGLLFPVEAPVEEPVGVALVDSLIAEAVCLSDLQCRSA